MLPWLSFQILSVAEQNLTACEIFDVFESRFYDPLYIKKVEYALDLLILKLTFFTEEDIRQFFYNEINEMDKIYPIFKNLKEKSHPTIYPAQESGNYLVMRLKTNSQIILRNYLNYVYNFSKVIEVSMSFEEIEDGFLLFYQRQQDLFNCLFINKTIAPGIK